MGRTGLPPQTVSSPGETLCVLPWIHSHISTSGNVQVCCVSGSGEEKPPVIGSIRSASIQLIFHSSRMQRIREQMASGQWPTECRFCQRKEALGVRSFRQDYNKKYERYYRELKERPREFVPRLVTLDLRINNLCNFKCRSCAGFSSSAWFTDHNIIYPQMRLPRPIIGFHDVDSFWQEFSRDILPDLEEVHFAGGEPLIMEPHYRLLTLLITSGKTDVELYYDTNLSRLTFKDWDIIELWRHFPNIRLSLSLDGVGRKGEYIRHGLMYEQWLRNLERVKAEASHADRFLHFVVSVFNVLDLREHYDAIISGEYAAPNRIGLTFLEWPPYLNVQSLHPTLKGLAAEPPPDAGGRRPAG